MISFAAPFAPSVRVVYRVHSYASHSRPYAHPTGTSRFADHARGGNGPAFLECRSERFASHSSATRDTRSAVELEAARGRCPVEALATRLARAGSILPDEVAALWQEARAEVERAIGWADALPFPDPEQALADV